MRLTACPPAPPSCRGTGCLPSACDALEEHDAPLLSRLTEELSADHVPELLAHADNEARMVEQIGAGADSVAHLIESLSELRQNLTAQAGTSGGGKRKRVKKKGAAGGTHRVHAVRDAEHWYDLLGRAGSGLVVADFGAEWCGACQQVKPFFEELSTTAGYEHVTFVSIDAERTPVLIGDNRVDSFPTFKFFRNSAEEDLPVVGADIDEVRQKIDELLRGAI